jgi:hypothetical protein
MARVFLLALLLAAAATGRAADAPLQAVQFPHVFTDNFGSNWDVQQDGSIGDGGNDLYDGGGRLMINNGAQYQSPNQTALLDAARNELLFPPVQIMGLNVSRRVACLASLNVIRFTEVLKNPTAAPIRAQVRCYFNMGGSVQQAIPLVDAKRKGRRQCGFAIGDANNAVAMISAGRGASAKLAVRFDFRQNDDNVDIIYDVEVPANKTVAVVHCQLRGRTPGGAADAWAGLREKQLLADLPRDLRRRVVNFPGGDDSIGDLEILRGDAAADVVELRGGDAYRGTLKVDQFKVQTLYGPIVLPADKIVGLINVGTYRPTQLLVTQDGDVFAGRLDVDALPLRMTGGQVTRVPLARITRVGFRNRSGTAADEGDEWNFENKPAAYLRGGGRLRVRPPAAEFNLATPAGPIRLSPAVVASVIFEGEDNPVPEIRLTDGSRLSALLGASQFDMTLAPGATGPGPDRHVRLPAAALTRLTFAAEKEGDFLTPIVTLANGDTLVGTVGGALSLETPFDTLHIDGPQIKALSHARGGDHDVTITLWDESTLSGRLVESHVSCLLQCGVGIRVPVQLIDHYAQPVPTPSDPVIRQIREVARQLDSDDWRTRDRAQSRLLALGPPVMSVLKQLQPTAPAEVAQRIDLIVIRLTRQVQSASGGGAGTQDAEGEVRPADPLAPPNGPVIIFDR